MSACKSHLLFPGDEDVPHVQHRQHQRRVQAEGGGEAGGEADGTLRSTRRPPDAAFPRHLGKHQERREARPTLQCQKNREDEGEGERGQRQQWGGEMEGNEPREESCFRVLHLLSHTGLQCVCLMNDL